MAYNIDLKNKVVSLRKKGLSLNELRKKTGIAKSTLSLWSSGIELNESAKKRLISKITISRFKSAETKKAGTRALEKRYMEEARSEMLANPNYEKIVCAIMYWCEGGKNPKRGLAFTNSDPLLVAKFLELLRKSFDINETKFHPCIHLHDYHNPERQLDFWSKITKIKKQQFIKPYHKPHTGKRIRNDYQGCVAIRYHSNDLARRIMAVAKAFLGA